MGGDILTLGEECRSSYILYVSDGIEEIRCTAADALNRELSDWTAVNWIWPMFPLGKK